MFALLPFTVILLGIAVFPQAVPAFWNQHSNKALFVGFVTVPTVAYLLMTHPVSVQHAALEYFAFMAMVGSLYVVAGGLVLRGDLPAGTRTNAGILAFGAVLANLIGTTGAAMVLIRPLLRANRGRAYTTHVPVFFIFVVANAGGLLTPLGDPPLFMGFLRGVPFTWTLQLFPVWLFVNAALIAVFAVIDRAKNEPIKSKSGPISVAGKYNAIFLLVIVAAIAALPLGVRELVMIAAAAASYRLTPKAVRAENGFNFHPIEEVAILFAGLFVTLQPALAFLQHAGPSMGLTTPREFFAVSGSLSSVLDNAPTYLAFFEIARTMAQPGDVLVGTTGVAAPLLIAISLGSVLMGANTYLGNGPNFMVKAICDEEKFKTPSFFGYLGWVAAILVPLWIAVAFIFLTG